MLVYMFCFDYTVAILFLDALAFGQKMLACQSEGFCLCGGLCLRRGRHHGLVGHRNISGGCFEDAIDR